MWCKNQTPYLQIKKTLKPVGTRLSSLNERGIKILSVLCSGTQLVI